MKSYMEEWLENGTPSPLIDEIARLRKALEFYALNRKGDAGYTATRALAGQDIKHIKDDGTHEAREL